MSYFHNFLRMLQDEDHLHEDEFEEHHDDDHNDDKPWGDVIVASLLVQLVTLSGLFVTMALGYYGNVRGNRNEVLHFMSFKIIPSFACGALLATAVFLVIPESLILLGGGHDAHAEEEAAHEEEHHDGERFLVRFLEEEHEDHEEHEEHNEAEASWKFGAALLSGFLFPILMHVFFPTHQHVSEGNTEEIANTNEDEGNKESQEEGSLEKSSPREGTEAIDGKTPNEQINWTLACSILLGDFFHNFTDGVFLGTAFLLCSRDVGYTIVATTIYHELAQEIADFALLHHHCGIAAWKAVVYNFASGFSVMIGGLLILSFDMSEKAQGTTLAIAAGVYIYIAACECVPRIQAVREGPKDTLLFFIMFVLGAIPIGLVLLNHQHCEAGHGDEENAEDHEGHDHLRYFM